MSFGQPELLKSGEGAKQNPKAYGLDRKQRFSTEYNEEAKDILVR